MAKADKFNNQTFEGKFKRTIYIASNYLLSTQKAKGPSQWPGKSSSIFLAGILSESIFDSDWSPIRFRNIKILSLKRAQSIQYISRLNENYV